MNVTRNERADAIIRDLLVNHWPRVKEGLEKGYVDENQVLAIYDHCVRARILTEHGAQSEADSVPSPSSSDTASSKQKDEVIASQSSVIEQLQKAMEKIVATGSMSHSMKAWEKCIYIAEAALAASSPEKKE